MTLTLTESRALASLCERGHALTGPAGTEPWTPLETLTAAGLARIAGRSAALILIEPTAAGRHQHGWRRGMTTKPKFTPGPWLAAESDTHDKRQAIWADGGLVGCAQVAILPPEFPRTKANAALIAAAPGGYTIIAALHDELLTLPEADPMRQKYLEPCADYLAKAEGRS